MTESIGMTNAILVNSPLIVVGDKKIQTDFTDNIVTKFNILIK